MVFCNQIQLLFFFWCYLDVISRQNNLLQQTTDFSPSFKLIPSDTFYFKSFVDCNMAEAWIGDTFRIFPGKYGEDPLWGYSNELKFANGKHADEAFPYAA